MKNPRKVVRTAIIFAWFAGFLAVGPVIFDGYYGRICRAHAEEMGWEYVRFSLGGRRGSPSCAFDVPVGDGQTERQGLAWRDVPRTAGERVLVVVPYFVGMLYFLPLIWMVKKLDAKT